MDNIIIVIAVIAFFLFTTYSNYKKEQEKANTRDPSRPQNRPSSTASSTPREVPNPIEIPKWLEDFLPPQEQVESKPEPVLVSSNEHHGSIDYKPVKYERVKYVPPEQPADLLKEYRNLPEKREIEELKRSVAIHSSHSHQFKRLQPLLVDKVEEEIEVPVFDLREAIIMNAILERPYQ